MGIAGGSGCVCVWRGEEGVEAEWKQSGGEGERGRAISDLTCHYWFMIWDLTCKSRPCVSLDILSNIPPRTSQGRRLPQHKKWDSMRWIQTPASHCTAICRFFAASCTLPVHWAARLYTDWLGSRAAGAVCLERVAGVRGNTPVTVVSYPPPPPQPQQLPPPPRPQRKHLHHTSFFSRRGSGPFWIVQCIVCENWLIWV